MRYELRSHKVPDFLFQNNLLTVCTCCEFTKVISYSKKLVLNVCSYQNFLYTKTVSTNKNFTFTFLEALGVGGDFGVFTAVGARPLERERVDRGIINSNQLLK